MKGLADRRWDDRFAERRRERVDGPPSGAVGRGDRFQPELAQRVDGLGYDALIGAGEMVAVQHAMQRRTGKAIASMRHDVDDARMGAGGEYDDALVLHVYCDESLVHEQGIGFP